MRGLSKSLNVPVAWKDTEIKSTCFQKEMQRVYFKVGERCIRCGEKKMVKNLVTMATTVRYHRLPNHLGASEKKSRKLKNRLKEVKNLQDMMTKVKTRELSSYCLSPEADFALNIFSADWINGGFKDLNLF